MSEQCIFCNLKEEALIYRDQNGIVILDDPIRPGHVLVGARVHVENLHDLSSEEAAAVLRLANQVAKSIVSLTGALKVYIAAIGDKDKHFHVHLLPKLEGDPNLGPYVFGSDGWINFLPSTPDAEELGRVNTGLRKQLAA
jgi:diadenosine tetraphosphate (Ap4A) HIT family hydrolase